MNESPIKDVVLEASKKYLASFQKATGGFEDRGILNSEMLAVCAISEELGVEVFIESGRWRGQSTDVLARYFSDKLVRVESIELYRDENALHVEEKMKAHPNLVLHYGDANKIIPSLVRKYQNKKIALLFDGPKGQAALDVFQFCLTQSKNVVAGFFHDMRKPTPVMPNASRGEMEKMFPRAFYTDDTEFVEAFKSLDQGCEVALWRPYAIDEKKIGSYGPTLGIILPERKEREEAQKNKFHLQVKTWERQLLPWVVKIYHALQGK